MVVPPPEPTACERDEEQGGGQGARDSPVPLRGRGGAQPGRGQLASRQNQNRGAAEGECGEAPETGREE